MSLASDGQVCWECHSGSSSLSFDFRLDRFAKNPALRSPSTCNPDHGGVLPHANAGDKQEACVNVLSSFQMQEWMAQPWICGCRSCADMTFSFP